MPAAPGWPSVTFRPVRYRRSSQLLAGILAVGFGIAAIVLAADGKVKKDGAAIAVVGVIVIVLGVVFLTGRRGQTTIDGQGLYASSPSGRHSHQWSEITGVRLDVNDRGDDPVVSTIKIDLSRGRTFTLAVPRDHETGTHHDNPEFPGQLATIRRYWQANSGVVQP
jgi:hypothetical protein